MPIDREKVIAEAAKKGIDMSWLERAPRGEVSGAAINRPSLSPQADQLMASVREQQARTPVFQPFAPGTPTQARREADERAKQFGISHEESVRQFEMGHVLSEEKLALQQQQQRDLQDYRNAQLELQRAADAAQKAAEAAGVGAYDWYDTLSVSQQQLVGPNIAGEVIEDFVRQAVSDGATWEEIKSHLLSWQNKQQLAIYRVADDDIIKIAADALERSINEIMGGLRPSPVPTEMTGTGPDRMIGTVREGIARTDLQREIRKAREEVAQLASQGEPDPLADYLRGSN